MSDRLSAGRYARALLDVAIADADPEQVEQELTAFAELFAGNPELQAILTNPAVGAAAKRGVVETIVARAKPSPVLGKLMLLLAERDRLSLVPGLAAVYRERLMEHRHIVRAEVTTAMPLSPAQAAQFEQRLAAATGGRVTMTTTVDASLIGGVIARVGSIVYDGSVATRLAKLRERLVELR